MPANARLTALTVIGILVLAGTPVFSSAFVGQVISTDTILDERSVPAGTTIHDGATVTTLEDPAVLHLATGQLVQVAQNSEAVLNGDDKGVQLVVLRGELAYREASGDTVALSAGTSSSLFQEPEIGGGAPVAAGDPNEVIAICHLDSGSDDFERLNVQRRDLQAHFDHGDVYADKDLRTPDMDPDIDCGRKVAWWWAGAGAVAAGVVLSDSSSSNPPGVASPIVP